MNYKLKTKYKGIVYYGNDELSIRQAILKKHPNDDTIISNLSILANKQEPAKDFKPSVEKKKLSFKDGVDGAYALFKVVTGQYVDQNEINRRSNICNNCPKLISSSNCVPCGFGKSVNNFITKLKKAFGKGFVIPFGLESKHCSVCECALSVMLPSSLKSFKHDKDFQSKRPDTCWLKKGSENYREN